MQKQKVCAVDVSPQSVQQKRWNAKANNLEHPLGCHCHLGGWFRDDLLKRAYKSSLPLTWHGIDAVSRTSLMHA